MKQVLKLAVAILLIGLATFISCKKEYSCENCKENKPPIANAGVDQTITSNISISNIIYVAG